MEIGEIRLANRDTNCVANAVIGNDLRDSEIKANLNNNGTDTIINNNLGYIPGQGKEKVLRGR